MTVINIVGVKEEEDASEPLQKRTKLNPNVVDLTNEPSTSSGIRASLASFHAPTWKPSSLSSNRNTPIPAAAAAESGKLLFLFM